MSISAKPRALLFLFLFALAPSAEALPYYVEFGGTTASWTTPQSVFQVLGKGTSTTASSSMGVPLTLGLQLQDSPRGILFSLALQNRYISGQTGSGSAFTVMPISPMFRIEIWRLVLGAGYSKYIARDLTFKKASAIQSSMTLEAQFLFPITPEIDFGLQAAQTTLSVDPTLAAGAVDGKAMEYGAYFRLNFGMSDSTKGERRKYKGWRYPFGSPLR